MMASIFIIQQYIFSSLSLVKNTDTCTLISLYITFNGNNTLLILLILFPGAIRNHILTWAVEKNRRIVDGYNYEVMIDENSNNCLIYTSIRSFQGCFIEAQ
jgi:hypothetical protein